MVIDEKKTWTPLRVKKEDGKLKQIYSDHAAMIIECDWSKGEPKSIEHHRLHHGPAEMAKFRQLLAEPILLETLRNKSEQFEERYSKWSEMVVTAYQQSGRQTKQRKFGSKEERILQKQYKELRRLQRTERDRREELKTEIQQLKEEIAAAEGRRLNNKTVQIVQSMKTTGGNINPVKFWEVYKKLTTRRKEPETIAINDKNGKRVEEPSQILEVYKEFYKKLLTPQQNETPIGIIQEEKINNKFNDIMKIAETQPPMKITKEGISRVIKSLKRKKAPDRDNWRNEMLMEGGEILEQHLLEIFNQVANKGEIPSAWERVKIKSIHKKGSVLEMDNRRGLFVTNVISKVWEKLILGEMHEEINMDIHQNGGQKGRGTLDNLMAIQTIIQSAKYLNQDVYIIFADAYKCFDKLWLQDCLVDLHEAGVRERVLSEIFKLNKQSDIIIETPAGTTQSITMGEIVKQGTVLGPQLCCASTVKINEVGPAISTTMSPNLQIAGLTYVDDIAGAGSENVVTNTCAALKKMEELKRFIFSTKKTKIMHVNKKSSTRELTYDLREGTITECENYNYLGNWFNCKGDFTRQLQEIEVKSKKIMGAITRYGQTTTTMEIGTKLFLYRETGVNTIFGDVELWPGLTKDQTQKLESIHASNVKYICGLPRTTPTWGVYAETGIWPIKYTILYKRVMIIHKLINGGDRLGKRVLQSQMEEVHSNNWYNETSRMIEEMGLTIETNVKEMTKSEIKKATKASIEELLQKETEMQHKTKTKMRYINTFKEKEYLTRYLQDDIQILMRVKLNMIKAKDNYGGKGECRICNTEKETTEHLSQCDQVEGEKVTENHIKSDKAVCERKVINRFKEIEQRLNQTEETNLSCTQQSMCLF